MQAHLKLAERLGVLPAARVVRVQFLLERGKHGVDRLARGRHLRQLRLQVLRAAALELLRQQLPELDGSLEHEGANAALRDRDQEHEQRRDHQADGKESGAGECAVEHLAGSEAHGYPPLSLRCVRRAAHSLARLHTKQKTSRQKAMAKRT